jgi:hypothetical protein
MNAQEVLNGLRRYLSESENERREIAAKMGRFLDHFICLAR